MLYHHHRNQTPRQVASHILLPLYVLSDYTAKGVSHQVWYHRVTSGNEPKRMNYRSQVYPISSRKKTCATFRRIKVNDCSIIHSRARRWLILNCAISVENYWTYLSLIERFSCNQLQIADLIIWLCLFCKPNWL